MKQKILFSIVVQLFLTGYVTAQPYSIRGNIKTSTGTPISEVEINYSGPTLPPSTVITHVDGNYAILGLKTETITLIPSKPGYTFSPTQISLMMDKDYTNQNFTAIGSGNGGNDEITYTISGTVTACGEPIAGVAIESRGQTYYTNTSGQYTVSGSLVHNGTFYEPDKIKLTFSKTGYVFPGEFGGEIFYFSSMISNNPTLTGEDFTIVKETDNITGIITYPDNTPAAGITLNIHNERTGVTEAIITDAEGKYSYPVIFPYGDHRDPISYRIEPVSDIYGFEPSLSINVDNTATCDYLKNKNFSAILPPTPICMVSVSENGKNIVVWEKPDIDVISGFKIYREGNQANVFEVLATVQYSDIAIYEDTNSDPSVKAYRYKIGTITTFDGIETELSVLHKTIHLTINKGVGSSYNLIWSHYDGLPVSTYKLYRGTSSDNMTFLTDIAGNLNSYTDTNAPATDVYYQIEMVLDNACNPEVAKPVLSRSTAANSYASTKSNVVNSGNIGINDINSDESLIYPNPVKDILYLTKIKVGTQFEIYSGQGTLIKQGFVDESINVSELQSGLYLLRIKTDEQWYRFVKQ